jgi:IS30 family transposase
VRAQALARRRRQGGRPHKLTACPELRATARDYLLQGWSPEQIAGWLRRIRGQPVIYHEAIYCFIYYRSAQKDYCTPCCLAVSRAAVAWALAGAVRSCTWPTACPFTIAPQADDCSPPGHWEADLRLFRKYGQAALVLHERSSRQLRVSRQPNKAVQPVAESLLRLFQPVPPLCATPSPQKGGIENAIGRMRRHLPRKTDSATLSPEELEACVQRHDNTPRKRLRFLSPMRPSPMVLPVLHFKRECIGPRAE